MMFFDQIPAGFEWFLVDLDEFVVGKVWHEISSHRKNFAQKRFKMDWFVERARDYPYFTFWKAQSVYFQKITKLRASDNTRKFWRAKRPKIPDFG